MRHKCRINLTSGFVVKIVAAAIKEKVQDCEVVFNLVPKENAMSDIYC